MYRKWFNTGGSGAGYSEITDGYSLYNNIISYTPTRNISTSVFMYCGTDNDDKGVDYNEVDSNGNSLGIQIDTAHTYFKNIEIYDEYGPMYHTLNRGGGFINTKTYVFDLSDSTNLAFNTDIVVNVYHFPNSGTYYAVTEVYESGSRKAYEVEIVRGQFQLKTPYSFLISRVVSNHVW